MSSRRSSRKASASRRTSENNLEQYAIQENPFEPKITKKPSAKNNSPSYNSYVAIDEPTYAVAVADETLPTASVLDSGRQQQQQQYNSYKRGSREQEAATGTKKPASLDNHQGTNSNSGSTAWPETLRQQVVKTFRRPPDQRGGGAYLEKHHWPEGLRQTVYKSCKKIAMRFFIVDDSGSMILNDGQRIIHGENTKIMKCTRWSELSEAILFQAELSEALCVPSEFRLLNGADPIMVGLGDDHGESLKFLQEVMLESPAGQTPLCQHIRQVVQSIQSIANELKANNQKAAVIIASDGESSDGNVADALRPLTNLPVLVILRLCTEEFQVVDYWNNIDQQLELDIDVLDDQLGDAKQVNQFNGWLTYGEQLHRMREFGASMKEMDIIDESTVSSEQMRIICAYIFLGGNPRDLPHPEADWNAFVNKIKQLNGTLPKVFCPINKTMRYWIDVNKLQRTYGKEGSGSSCVIM